MGYFSNYAGGDMQTARPVSVHEGPTGSWPGTVSPADAYYDQTARLHSSEMPQQQQLQRQRIGTVAELGVILAPSDEELDPRQIGLD